MKIACTSDLHGHLPPVPECDLLLIGGDIVPLIFHEPSLAAVWLDTNFRNWLKEVPAKAIVGVAGNHDFIFEEPGVEVPVLPWTYLQDEGTEVGGFKIYGTPWQKPYFDWAFQAKEETLAQKWARIPDDTDILLLHGPPHGYGDFSPHDKVHTGSPSLLARIKQIRPKLVVAGHIHSGFGRYMIGDTVFLNVALVNEKYRPVHEPVVIDL